MHRMKTNLKRNSITNLKQ